MSSMFSEYRLGNLVLQNRVIRSATFEGMADLNGVPKQEYIDFYRNLANKSIGGIITGFTYISPDGKAMQPGQAGIDSEDKKYAWLKVTENFKDSSTKLFLQIAHTGRQSTIKASGGIVYGVSTKRSIYFRTKPTVLTTEQCYNLVDKFVNAACLAQEYGFHGIQLHAAHGYLIHQFILPSINNRKDEYGIDSKYQIGIYFLKKIIEGIRKKCGDFAIIVKISHGDDYRSGFTELNYLNLIDFLNEQKVDAIEISYGTMDYALNIFRGKSIPWDAVLNFNPIYGSKNPLYRWLFRYIGAIILLNKIKPFEPAYNLHAAAKAVFRSKIPIISVGGFRIGTEMEEAIEENMSSLIALCRPFLCEPDFVLKLTNNLSYQSKCVNCNICSVMCDSNFPTKCWKKFN